MARATAARARRPFAFYLLAFAVFASLLCSLASSTRGRQTPALTLRNDVVEACVSSDGLRRLELLVSAGGRAREGRAAAGVVAAAAAAAGAAAGFALDVAGDAFEVVLRQPAQGKETWLSPRVLPPPRVRQVSHSAVELIYDASAAVGAGAELRATYELLRGAASVAKTLELSMRGAALRGRAGSAGLVLERVAVWANMSLVASGAPPSDHAIAKSRYGLGDTGLFLRWTIMPMDSSPATSAASTGYGALVTARNPFLRVAARNGGEVSVSYSPSLPWDAARGPLRVDVGVLGVHLLRGAWLPALSAVGNVALNEAERDAMQAAARAAMPPAIARRRQTRARVHVAWCENDYQLDAADPADRVEYSRILDASVKMGATHLVFAPRNSDVSSAANNTDTWGWEQLLWFGMGQRIRDGRWKPGRDALPESLQAMLADFRRAGVRPLAYVYPILAFLAGTLPDGGSPSWIYNTTDYPGGGPVVPRASLADVSFQDWLASTLVAFANATGSGGFAFDFTYFEDPRVSQYTQWAGWRNILQALQTDEAGAACGGWCHVDNRQQSHEWGPWMWALGGTYAEPLASDENPETWPFSEADLHTDRLLANRQRRVAWEYANLDFAPGEVVPGFAFHQIERRPTRQQAAVCTDGRCGNFSRRQDWDAIGFRYSLLSSIGAGGGGGLNTVLNALPARDASEYNAFPEQDAAWVRLWLDWADMRQEQLARVSAVPLYGSPHSAPTAGRLDAAWVPPPEAVGTGDARGFLFIFNPTARELRAMLALDGGALRGLDCGMWPLLELTHVDSSESPGVPPYTRAVVRCGDLFELDVPPTTALVVGVCKWLPPRAAEGARLIGAPGNAVVATHAGLGLRLRRGGGSLGGGSVVAHLKIEGASGVAGDGAELLVAVPAGSPVPLIAYINGATHPAAVVATAIGNTSAALVRGRWAGESFTRSFEVEMSPVSQVGNGVMLQERARHV